MDLIERDAMSWIYRMEQWMASVNTVMNLQVCLMAGDLSRWQPLASQIKVCCMELDSYVREMRFQAKEWFTLV
jgi:hypothetical protein